MKIISQDLLAGWHGKKFVLADPDLYDGSGHLVILTDLAYWIPNLHQLAHWCQHNQAQIQGTTVLLPNEHVLCAFMLRWS